MPSTLWLISGSAAYVVVAVGIFLKLKPKGWTLAVFLLLAVVLYVPFVGFPFLTEKGRQEENQREIATLQTDVLKKQLGIIDSATGLPKEDRYLNPKELEALIEALAHKLPAVSARPLEGDAPPICYYLYLYAWFHDNPTLTLNEKWSAALYMPRTFYKPDDGLPANITINYDSIGSEVRRAWKSLGKTLAVPPFCSDPP